MQASSSGVDAPSGRSSPHAVLTDAAHPVTIVDATLIVREHYGVSATLTRLSGERDDNFRVESGRGTWMFKIAHGAEAATVTAFQSAILTHLAGSGVSVPTVVPTVDGTADARIAAGPAAGRAIRMTTFSPGVLLRNAPASPGLARRIGAALAGLDSALDGFDHPGAHAELLWDVQQTHRVRELLDDGPALPRADVLRRGLDRFLTEAAPRLRELPGQVIHNDANPDNVLVVPGDPPAVAFIDFGDAVWAPRVADLAVAASYHVGAPDLGSTPLGAATDVIVGYHERSPLQPEEIGLLPDLLVARVLTAITIASWRATVFPDNAGYVLRNIASAWHRLDVLEAAGHEVTADLMRRLA